MSMPSLQPLLFGGPGWLVGFTFSFSQNAGFSQGAGSGGVLSMLPLAWQMSRDGLFRLLQKVTVGWATHNRGVFLRRCRVHTPSSEIHLSVNLIRFVVTVEVHLKARL